MKNALKNFEKSIQNFLKLYQKHQQISLEDCIQFNIKLDNQAEQLKESTNELFFSNQSNAVIKRILKFYYKKMVTLSDYLYLLSQGSTVDHESVFPQKEHEQTAFLNGILCIEKLLQSIVELSHPIFDDGIQLPKYNIDLLGENLKKRFNSHKNRLKRSDIHPMIISSLDDYFNEINSTRNVPFTYRQAEYAHKLLRGIERMMKNDSPHLWPENVWQLFIYLNFNKKNILKYSHSRLKEKALNDKPYSITIEIIHSLLKELRVMEINPNWSYEIDRISLKSYNETLLIEEINFQKDFRNTLEKDQLLDGDYFIIMDTTVRQLVFWTHINSQLQRLIIPKNCSIDKPIKILTTFIRTLNTNTISFESARKKKDYFDSATVKGLHLHLSEQLQYIEKYHAKELSY